jgi:hypothetical protein
LLGALALSLIGGALAAGCGSTPATTGEITCSGACSCSGSTCTCQSGDCALGPVSEGDGGLDAGAPPDGVNYQCTSQATCTSVCGTGCSSTCNGQAACSPLRGAGRLPALVRRQRRDEDLRGRAHLLVLKA